MLSQMGVFIEDNSEKEWRQESEDEEAHTA